MKKPYSVIREITYEMIKKNPYFFNLTEAHLVRIVCKLRHSVWTRLMGSTHAEKAKYLRKGYIKLVVVETMEPKTAVELKPKPKPKKTYKLTNFHGYHLKRTATHVKFGCGIVSVAKSDLLRLSKIMSPEFITENNLSELLKNVQNQAIPINYLNQVTPAQLKFLVSPEFKLIDRTYRLAYPRIGAKSFWEITPEQYKDLAQ